MNLGQLLYLVETVRQGSYSAAAPELFVTPQTISKSLSELEAELGIKLFERNGKRLVITDQACLLAEKAENVLAAVSDLEGLAYQLKSNRELKASHIAIAVASTPLRERLVSSDLLGLFKKRNPNIEVTIRENGSESCLNAVEQKLVDAAITLGRTSRLGLKWTQIYPFKFSVTVSRNNPLADRPIVDILSISNYQIATPMDFRCAYRLIERQFEVYGLKPRYTDIVPDKSAHQEFLNSNGIIFTAQNPCLENVYNDIVTLPLIPEDRITIPICLIYREDNSNPSIPILQKDLLITGKAIKYQLN